MTAQRLRTNIAKILEIISIPTCNIKDNQTIKFKMGAKSLSLSTREMRALSLKSNNKRKTPNNSINTESRINVKYQ